MMPAKEKRKVLPIGDSLAVTLPKPYRDYYNIEPGDEVEVLYDSLMLILPRNAKISEKKRQLLEELLSG